MYELDLDYFDKINDSNKAYWLGFISADGNVYKNKFSIELSEKDEKHLEKLKNDLKTNRPLYHRCRNNKQYVSIEISNKHFVDNLKRHGIVPRKTWNLIFPDIPDIYYKDYIRGFIDGDGYYSFNKRYVFRKERNKYCTRINCEAGIVCKSFDFLNKIYNILLNNEIDCHLCINSRDKLYTLRIYGIKNCRNLINYIYYDNCTILKRKEEKILEIQKYCLA